MSTAHVAEIVQPGKDERSHQEEMNDKVADALTALTGGSVTKLDVTPPIDQHPVPDDPQGITSPSEPIVD